jgi:hypothetical protein
MAVPDDRWLLSSEARAALLRHASSSSASGPRISPFQAQRSRETH